MHVTSDANKNEMRYEDDSQIWISPQQVGDFEWNWAKVWSLCLNVYVAHTLQKFEEEKKI